MHRTDMPLLLAVAVLGLGCSGQIFAHPETPSGLFRDGGTIGPGEATPELCAKAPVNVPAQALSRLTAEEYLNTQRDLFQKQDLTLDLDSSDGSSAVITQLEAQKINDAAADVVATGGHTRFLGCSITGAFNDACAQKFIQDFGLQAFRRPLAADEVTWLVSVYAKVKALTGITPAATFKDAIDSVAQVMVQAPQHLYLSAQGTPDSSLPAGINRTTGYERATRISYGLAHTTPDATLLDAAAKGSLDTADGLRAQAARILDSAAGHTVVRGFVDDYLGLEGSPVRPTLEEMPKNPVRFPLDSPALRTALRTESRALYEHVFYDLGGSYSTLMSTTQAYVNGPLASLYGVQGGPSSASTFSWVNLDATQRAGVFTRAAFLTEMANQEYESPIQRGVQLFKHVLCQPLGPPPPNANNNQPPLAGTTADGVMSVRQTTDARTAAPACQACHSQLNPIGYTLNDYDALGQWQTKESGTGADGGTFTVPVDALSIIPATDLKGTVHGGIELSQKLAQSAQAQSCMAQTWLTRVASRPLGDEDACTTVQLSQSFQKSGGDMRALVLDAAVSPATLYVRMEN